MADRPGALVISLDFELHWGIRDHVTRDDALFGRLPEARKAVRDMLDVFTARQIRATWATVGFLFASTRDELDACLPDERPAYRRGELDPYVEAIGVDEERDPEHLAGSLVELISCGDGQEVGSHTFSHYYCLEAGQNEATFRADLAAAQAIALRPRPEADQSGAAPQPVEPRLREGGPGPGVPLHPRPPTGHGAIELTGRAERSPSRGQVGRHVHRSLASSDDGVERRPACVGPLRRAGQRVLASVRARPQAARIPARVARLRSGLRHAAQHGRIFHLWWHPHNFSQHQPENFAVLEQVLDEFDRLAVAEGMQSLTMSDVSAMVASAAQSRTSDPE